RRAASDRAHPLDKAVPQGIGVAYPDRAYSQAEKIRDRSLEGHPNLEAVQSASMYLFQAQIVGMVPPSITISVPVIAEARSDAAKATSSATSSGWLGRPNGMPPSMSISFCR